MSIYCEKKKFFLLKFIYFLTNVSKNLGFGFCEFGSPESALRAVRLLHDLNVGGKKLVVKVDAKTKVQLDDYKKEERKKQKKPELELKEGEEIEDYLDDNMKRMDLGARDKIITIIDDFKEEMNNALIEKNEEAKLKKGKKNWPFIVNPNEISIFFFLINKM